MLLLDKLHINDRTKNNNTLLHIAIEHNVPIEDIVIFLLMGANINLKDSKDKTAWEYLLNPDKSSRN